MKYSFKLYKDTRDQNKMNKAYAHAEEAVKIYQTFIDFCHAFYNKKILNKKAKRLVNEYTKELKKAFPEGGVPSESWVYKMAKSIHYLFEPKWPPSFKPKVYSLKSDHECKKTCKTHTHWTKVTQRWIKKRRR